MDVFAAVRADGRVSAGRGAEDGWVHCPLCTAEAARRREAAKARRGGRAADVSRPHPAATKRFARGRGIRAHVEHFHRAGQGHWADALGEQGDDVPRAEAVAAVLLAADATVTGVGTDRQGHACGGEGGRQHAGLAAAARGDVAAVERLLAGSWDFLTDGLDKYGSNAAEWAAGAGHLDVVRLLLRPSVPTERLVGRKTQGTRGGRTVLHWAARNGRTEVVLFLVADRFRDLVDVRAGDGTTPLHLALYGGHVETAGVLVEHGADLELPNDWGCAAAHWAAMCTQKASTARHPCQDGSDESAAVEEPEDGALAVATLRWVVRAAGDESTARRLIVTRQHSGHTAMHKAAQRGNRAACEYILAAFPSPAHAEPDDAGHRPSEVAAAFGHTNLAEILARSEKTGAFQP